MKTYKLIDFIIGCLLIISSVLFILFKRNDFLFAGYFIVGGWQLTSAIAHRTLKKHFIASGYRRIYEIAVIIVLLGGIISYIGLAFSGGSVLFLFLYILLYFSPVLAIYYQVVCYIEYRLLIKRAFIHLKN